MNVEVYRPVAGAADELVQTRSATRSAVDGSWSVSASPALADGTVRGVRDPGRQQLRDAYSAPRRFTVDTTEPGVTLTAPPVGHLTNDTTPTLSGGAGTTAATRRP